MTMQQAISIVAARYHATVEELAAIMSLIESNRKMFAACITELPLRKIK